MYYHYHWGSARGPWWVIYSPFISSFPLTFSCFIRLLFGILFWWLLLYQWNQFSTPPPGADHIADIRSLLISVDLAFIWPTLWVLLDWTATKTLLKRLAIILRSTFLSQSLSLYLASLRFNHLLLCLLFYLYGKKSLRVHRRHKNGCLGRRSRAGLIIEHVGIPTVSHRTSCLNLRRSESEEWEGNPVISLISVEEDHASLHCLYV